jgi:quinol monooxygenase YgiN
MLTNRTTCLFRDGGLALSPPAHVMQEIAMSPTNRPSHPASTDTELCSPIIDLRQYTVYPGTRDAFIDLFDREFVETQEAAGMRLIGQFRDLGDPNRFVWLRGFADMAAREKALTQFYLHGEAWQRHAEAARSMMIDSSDALLLRPVRPDLAFALERPACRAAPGSASPESLVVATIHHLPAPADADLLGFFDRIVGPAQIDAGARLLGLVVTEHSPNNFPRLPLREGENVLVSFLGFADIGAYHHCVTALGRNPRWRGEIYPALIRRLSVRPQILRLAPTARSQLRA